MNNFFAKAILSLVFYAFIFTAAAQSPGEQQIRNSMAVQQESWNRGDIKGFMQTYWKSDSLTFIGKSGVTYGWQQTLNNYIKAYPDTASMGKLNFTLLQVKRLSPEYYWVVGKWALTRSIGNLAGHFTLLFRKMGEQWLIVSDHST